MERGHVGRAVRSGHEIRVPRIADAEGVQPDETPFEQGTLVALPLQRNADTVGALLLSDPRPEAYDEVFHRQLQILARMVGLALQAASAQVQCLIAEREAMRGQSPCVVGDPWEDLALDPLPSAEDHGVLVVCGDDARGDRLLQVVRGLGLVADRLAPDDDDTALRPRLMAFAPDALLLDMGTDLAWTVLARLLSEQLDLLFPLLLCGFDPRSGQAWLGRPDAVAFSSTDRDALLHKLALDEPDAKAGPMVLVDNNPLHAQRYEDWLEPSAECLFLEPDGALGIERIVRATPTHVVSDMLMPDRCGLQLVAELARASVGQAPRCVLLLPEHLTDDERALLVHDAAWVAALHGVEIATWTRLLRKVLAPMMG